MARFSWPCASIWNLDIAGTGKASGAERRGAQNGPNQCDLKRYQIAVVLHKRHFQCRLLQRIHCVPFVPTLHIFVHAMEAQLARASVMQVIMDSHAVLVLRPRVVQSKFASRSLRLKRTNRRRSRPFRLI